MSMLRVEVGVAATLTATTFGVVDCGTVPDVLELSGDDGLAGDEADGALAAAGALAGIVVLTVPLLPSPPQPARAKARMAAITNGPAPASTLGSQARSEACRAGALIADPLR
ncbi:hypothetical protein [Paraburkholderia sp. J63]|uniref:hypothetical protein n=1 Tax=Paraburkholderia sp. J63 TaxID=2805434 RepID=UPI002ABD4C20|nr:hypothetical protein [Paraburkholderia sp. J63]